MRVLRHKFGMCIGDFALTNTYSGTKVRCEECGAQYPDMPSIRIAMASENFASAMLSALTAEGALALATDDTSTETS